MFPKAALEKFKKEASALASDFRSTFQVGVVIGAHWRVRQRCAKFVADSTCRNCASSVPEVTDGSEFLSNCRTNRRQRVRSAALRRHLVLVSHHLQTVILMACPGMSYKR